MKISYELIIYWSEEDAELVIQEWIETAKQLERIIPEPKGRLLFT